MGKLTEDEVEDLLFRNPHPVAKQAHSIIIRLRSQLRACQDDYQILKDSLQRNGNNPIELLERIDELEHEIFQYEHHVKDLEKEISFLEDELAARMEPQYD